MQELVRFARAMLMLQMRQLETTAQSERGAPVRFELLLADAGFSAKEIAEMLGKNYAAVAKAISRARAARPRDTLATDEQQVREDGE